MNRCFYRRCSFQRVLHREEVRAREDLDALLGDLFGHRHADLFHLLRRFTANKCHRAFQRVAFKQAVQVVWQSVVDRCFNRTVKTEHPFASGCVVMRAMGDVVLQHFGLPKGKGFFAGKVRQCSFRAVPAVAPLLADFARPAPQ